MSRSAGWRCEVWICKAAVGEAEEHAWTKRTELNPSQYEDANGSANSL